MTDIDEEHQGEAEQELGSMLDRLVIGPMQQYVGTVVATPVSIIQKQLEQTLDDLSSIKTRVSAHSRDFNSWARGPDEEDDGFREWVDETRKETRKTAKSFDDFAVWAKTSWTERQIEAAGMKVLAKRQGLLIASMLVLSALNSIGVAVLLFWT